MVHPSEAAESGWGTAARPVSREHSTQTVGSEGGWTACGMLLGHIASDVSERVDGSEVRECGRACRWRRRCRAVLTASGFAGRHELAPVRREHGFLLELHAVSVRYIVDVVDGYRPAVLT